MRRVRITDSRGKPLTIALLTDLDLIVAIPYTIASALTVAAQNAFFRVIRLPVDLLYVGFCKSNLSLVWSLAFFPLSIAAASLLTTQAGNFSYRNSADRD